MAVQFGQKAVRYPEQDGMLKAIENGYPQREIQEAEFQYQKAVEKNEAVVVGVNKF